MRTPFRAVAAVAAAVLVAGTARPAAAQTNFAGTYTFTAQSATGTPTTVVIAQKGGKMRFEPKGAGAGGMSMVLIFDADAKSTTMVFPAQKMYMTRTRSASDEATAPSTSSTPKANFTKTGATKVVAGVTCQIYHASSVVNGEKQEGNLCLAKGVGINPLDMQRAMGGRANFPPEAAALQDLLTSGYGLLEATTVRNGQPGETMEVTSIDRSTPSDALFVPPPDYKAMPAGAMGMMGGMGHATPAAPPKP